MIPGLLLLCVIAATAWLALTLAGRRQRDPMGSAAGFARALSALADEQPRDPQRRSARRRPPPRPRLPRAG
ncbi:MAG TPA: hypothetical protein VML96_05065 [Egibacteraceae bacterium]|nr:hypothetical protein [Egibacteraceae bacterium]